jgi:hypothetical protein
VYVRIYLESFSAQLDDPAIWQSESFLKHGGFLGQLALLLDVISYIAELLFDLTHRLEVSSTVEGVSTEQQELMIMMMMMMRLVYLFIFKACTHTAEKQGMTRYLKKRNIYQNMLQSHRDM